MIFQYYVPVPKAVLTPAILRERGLGIALRDCLRPEDFAEEGRLSLHAVHSHGPDGMSGTIVAPLPADGSSAEIGYYPDRQTWERWDDYYWLGTANGVPPTPAALARTPEISGYDVLLGDGQTWHIPTLRRPTGVPNLPQCLGRRPDGTFISETEPEFAWAWKTAGEIWDAISRDDVPYTEAFDWCVQLLSLNYRLGVAEVTRLKLVTTTNVMEQLKAAIDWPRIEQLLGRGRGKKNEREPTTAEAATTSPGPPGD